MLFRSSWQSTSVSMRQCDARFRCLCALCCYCLCLCMQFYVHFTFAEQSQCVPLPSAVKTRFHNWTKDRRHSRREHLFLVFSNEWLARAHRNPLCHKGATALIFIVGYTAKIYLDLYYNICMFGLCLSRIQVFLSWCQLPYYICRVPPRAPVHSASLSSLSSFTLALLLPSPVVRCLIWHRFSRRNAHRAPHGGTVSANRERTLQF